MGLVEQAGLLGLVEVGVVLGSWDDELAQATVGREDAMETGEVEPLWGHDGGEPGNQVHGVEQDGLGPVAPRGFQGEAQSAVLELGEAVVGQWRSCEVATEALELGSVAAIDEPLGVHVICARLRLAR
jgi:hypothetical protein